MQDDISVSDNHRRRKRSHHRDAFPDEPTNGLHSPRWRQHYHDSTDEPQRKRRRSQGSPDRRGDKGLATATEGTRYVSNTPRETALGLTGVLNDKLESPGAEANTLQNVKRNLLKRSDWTGLSATRPAKMVFATVREMENIGKRRQIPEPGVRRKAGARRDSNFHPAINRHPLVDQNGSNTSILHTEKASVKIGSNIHRTQTTPQLNNRDGSTPHASQSASTESMLLDKFDGGASLLDHTQKAKEALRPTDSQHSLSPKIPIEIPRQGEKRPAFPHSGQVHPFKDSQFPRLRAHASSSKERSEVDSGRILPSLDQLRDIKNFDELKASSAVRPSQGLTFLPQFSHRSTMQKEVLGNGRSGDESSSIVNGWRLLPSCDDSNQSADQDSVVEQTQSHPMIFRQSQATRADTTKSPRAFLPEHPSNSVSPADVDVPDRDFPTNYREQICSSLGLDTSAGRTTANGTAATGPGNLVEVYLPQPIFTLEQQVSDEMTAKVQIDACQSSTFNRPEDTDPIASASTTRSYQSWTKYPARPSHYEAFLHHIEPLSNRRLDVVVSKTSASYATRPKFESLSAVSNEERSPNLLNRTTQTPPRDVSEATLRPIVMTSLFQPTSLKGVPRVRQLQDGNNRLNYTPSRLLRGSVTTDQKVDHDEALMESLVPSLGELRNAFEFEPRIRRRSVNVRISTREEAREAGEVTRSNKLACRPPSTRVVQNASPTTSIRTSANTVLYSARELPSSQPVIGIEPSETSFLTQMSPMEGELDERLANISVYNNAARSIRSFVPVASPKIGSLRYLQSDAGVAYSQDTNLGARKFEFSRHELWAGSRSTHRESLQYSTEGSIVAVRPCTSTPQARRTGFRLSRDLPRSGPIRPVSPRIDSARKTDDNMRALRASRQPMSPLPSQHTPIRRKPWHSESDNSNMTTSDYLNHFQAFSADGSDDGLAAAVQHGQIAESFPRDHESALRNSQTCDIKTFPESGFADEDALHILPTDVLGACSGSSGSGSAAARWRCSSHYC